MLGNVVFILGTHYCTFSNTEIMLLMKKGGQRLRNTKEFLNLCSGGHWKQDKSQELTNDGRSGFRAWG